MSEDLFQAFQKGDMIAFKQYYKEYYPRINYFIQTVVSDQTDAEDIAANCFVRFWKSYSKVKNPEHLNNLLYNIARNLCIDHLRAKKRNQQGTEALLEMLRDPSYLEGAQVDSDLLAKLHQYIGELGDKPQKVLWLLYRDGLGYAEIAEQLGMTVNNVYQLRNRGIGYLKSKMLKPALLPLLLSLYFSLPNNHPVGPFLERPSTIFESDDIKASVLS